MPPRPSERLTIAFLAVLLGLALILRPPGWIPTASALAGMLAFVAGLPRLRGSRGALFRDFAPIGIVLGIYLLLQPLVAAANGYRGDLLLAAWDSRLFGAFMHHWRTAFGRPDLLTDAMYGAYASFYLLPVGVAAMVRSRRGAAGFERVVFALLLGFYLSFLGYFLCPAEGPRVPRALESAQLGGSAFSEAIRGFLHASERTTLDAFPSGHTALSLLPAMLATRLFPRWAVLLWAWALAIVFATVYLSLHYGVDVVAGILLALLTYQWAGPLSLAFGAPPGRAQFEGPGAPTKP